MNQTETLRKIVYFKQNKTYFKQMFFFSKTTIATLYTARNLFAFSSHNQILDLYYKVTIIVPLFLKKNVIQTHGKFVKENIFPFVMEWQ